MITDNRIVYVDLDKKKVEEVEITRREREEYIGGAGLNTKILFDSEAMFNDALSDENVLVFGVGVGTGSGLLNGNRGVITGKSPVTDLFGDSNIGGDFPIYLKRLGIDHLVLRNTSEKPVYIYISAKREVQFIDADDLLGMNTDDVTDLLQARYGGNCEVACIGPAGEKLCRFASIAMSKTHFAGRMGMGCIMGHKKVKAIVIEKTNVINNVYDKEKLKNISKNWLDSGKTSVTFKMMSLEGTLLLVKQYNETDTIPINNCANNKDERCENLYARVFRSEFETKKNPCKYCAMGCAKDFEIKKGRFKGEGGSRIDYGSVASFGPAIGIFDYAEVIHLKLLGDKFGMDSMECASAIALTFELQNRGLLPPEYQNEKLYKFGSVEGAEHLMSLMVSDDEFGKILAQGSYRASRILKAEKYAFCVKKSSIGLQSKRRKAWALGYITSTRGGDHLKNFPFTSIFGGPFAEMVAKHIFKRDFKGNYHKSEEKGRVVWWHENYKYALDSIGLCLFGMHGIVTQGRGYFNDLAEVMNSLLGTALTEEQLFYCGERIYQLQNAFNIVSGMKLEDYKLPQRKKEEGVNKQFIEDTDIKENDEGMLPEYFYFRGLSKDGRPTIERFKEIGLSHYIDLVKATEDSKTGKMEEVLKEVRLSFKMTIGEKIKSRIIYKIVTNSIEKGMKKAKKMKMEEMKKMGKTLQQ
ncbi:aldehyde ferredoxin oxidoreductase family protein [Alkaliphilus transvaalensis]|uniref:aldehyde ferredoxin oxidoreductase family protein n=1 Tax=Alkaliphilus transvaalensis TaxID=114628 RepID=UPI000ACC38B3|nr:aldehyde ferredoxin oxidoreductase family protein [Alkaliphilus transvaalensis]